MKTMVRSETVQFGTVTQCGRHGAFVRTENGAEIRLCWSHLRLVESACGGIIFSTGKSATVRRDDGVAFVPQKTGLWIWTLRADYETVRDFLARSPGLPVAETALPVAPLPPSPPAPEINLDSEIVVLGSERLRKWRQRYPQQHRAFA
ncbi:MAG: hypothetical protein G01um101470_843 [Parcubacteria group bacterium Gr01-1014_70]|nr:MAG: hypothetical protein G01um101470_843 [Parcubacteria group bacterium Gr01-1014_70]